MRPEKDKRNIAGIILAAGGSRRLGTAKQLLLWREKPLLWHVARLAISCDLSPVIVVTGSRHESVEVAINKLPVKIVYNDRWSEGQSTSIIRGMGELPDTTRACFFFLCDQPQIPQELVKKVIDRYDDEKSFITAPRVQGRRANPVLFDRATFPELLKLKANTGGRVIFDRYVVDYLDWEDDSILIDVDTEESYQQLLRLK